MTQGDLTDTQFECVAHRFFSFTSMCHGKQLSPVAFLVSILEDVDLQKMIVERTEMSLYDFIRRLAQMNPILYKSRRLSNVITSRGLTLNINAM